MQVSFNTIKNIGINVLKDDCMGLASEMAFNFLLSLFPFAIFIFAILSVFGNESFIYPILNILKIIAPEEALNLIEEVLINLFKTSSSGILTISFIGTLWTASNAVMSLMKGLNRVYRIKETRPFWKTRFISFLVVLSSGIIILFCSNLIILFKIILYFSINIIPISGNISDLMLFIRWPVAFCFLFLIFLLVYYFLPNLSNYKNIRLYNVIPGALFFCTFWLLASWVFSLYVENFGRYNAIYGSLGAVVILLLWLYYTSLIILIGGEINTNFYKIGQE